jgi:hypothetical protein
LKITGQSVLPFLLCPNRYFSLYLRGWLPVVELVILALQVVLVCNLISAPTYLILAQPGYHCEFDVSP